MPLSTKIVGQAATPIVHEVDARWIMAYAAGLGDLNPRMMDTAAYSPVVAHPVFPVCVEWPAVLAAARLPGSEIATMEERARGVHAAHDLHIHRPIRAGDVLTTTADVVGLEMRKPGAAQMTRLVARDAQGAAVSTTWQLGITATLALGVSGIVNKCLDGDVSRVTRLGGRFSAMVPVPDRLQLEIYRRGPGSVRFRVRNGQGQEAISQGFLFWR